jgi:hypothetical protein
MIALLLPTVMLKPTDCRSVNGAEGAAQGSQLILGG